MDLMPITLPLLRLMLAATVLIQLGLLVAVPVPSPVATRRRMPWRRSPGGSPAADPWPALLMPLVALAGLGAVLAAAAHPEALSWLVPTGAHFPLWLAPASGVALFAGNLLVAAAALTLKRRTTFDGDGQSAALVTDGVFGLARHPIVLGLALIYLGFFLALPSPLVLVGLTGYLGHQHRRLAAEEALLEKRFGRAYRAYRRRVGRFGPAWRAPKQHC